MDIDVLCDLKAVAEQEDEDADSIDKPRDEIVPIIDVINEHVTTLKTIAVELGDLTGKMPYLGRIMNDIVGKNRSKFRIMEN